VGDLSVSTNKIQDNAITTAKIAAGAVIPADLSTGAPSWTEAGLLQFNSGYGSVATAYGCRAWVNFNGTGTPAIRGSGNVTSITDNGTGNYTVNFTTAMPDTNYAVVCMGGDSSAVFGELVHAANPPAQLTTSVQFLVSANNTSARADSNYVAIAVFR
jgi:hypothetical protein